MQLNILQEVVMTEREAAARLDAICYTYGSSSERKNRLGKAIMEYIQAAQKSGLDRQPGYFNCGHLRETFGIEFSDQPEVRYNKIATYRL